MENPSTGLRSRLRDPRYYGHPDSWSSLSEPVDPITLTESDLRTLCARKEGGPCP